MGVKKGEVMRLLHAGVGRMLCDYDVIMDNVNQTSIICHSAVGQMFVLTKEDFKKLQTISDESFQHLKAQSKKEQQQIRDKYIANIEDALKLG